MQAWRVGGECFGFRNVALFLAWLFWQARRVGRCLYVEAFLGAGRWFAVRACALSALRARGREWAGSHLSHRCHWSEERRTCLLCTVAWRRWLRGSSGHMLRLFSA